MKIGEADFIEGTSLEMQSYIRTLVEKATCLDDIFDEWFLKMGHRIGLGTALNDDHTVIPDVLLLYFDTSDGQEVGEVLLSRSEVMERHPNIESFDTFVKAWSPDRPRFELYKKQYDAWVSSLGFSDSYALMAAVGPRSAATALMVSFALSSGGSVEAKHLDPAHYDDIDYKQDLDEEGIDLHDYFHIYASYSRAPDESMAPLFMFDPFYCRKTA